MAHPSTRPPLVVVALATGGFLLTIACGSSSSEERAPRPRAASPASARPAEPGERTANPRVDEASRSTSDDGVAAAGALLGGDELHRAAFAGEVERLKELLDAGVQVDGRSEVRFAPTNEAGKPPKEEHHREATALHAAVLGNQPKAARLLLERGADPEAATEKGWTPLLLAGRHGRARVTRVLLRKGADPDARDREGRTPLHHAAAGGHAQTTKALLGEGKVNPDLTSAAGHTPLYEAAAYDQPRVARVLLEAGAKVDAAGEGSCPPINVAALLGYARVVRRLLEHGAKADADCMPEDVPAPDKVPEAVAEFETSTPADFALVPGRILVLKLMVRHRAALVVETLSARMAFDTRGYVRDLKRALRAGLDPNAADSHGDPLLVLAARQDDDKVISALLEAGADPIRPGSDGQRPLHVAALFDNTKAARTLLAGGVDPNLLDQERHTPLLRAAEGAFHSETETLVPDHRRMVRLLLERGADPNAKDPAGRTALHRIASAFLEDDVLQEADDAEEARPLLARRPDAPELARRRRELMETLLRHGARHDVKDAAGRTPLHLAAESGRREAVCLLLARGADPGAPDAQGRSPKDLAATEAVRGALEAGRCE